MYLICSKVDSLSVYVGSVVLMVLTEVLRILFLFLIMAVTSVKLSGAIMLFGRPYSFCMLQIERGNSDLRFKKIFQS